MAEVRGRFGLDAETLVDPDDALVCWFAEGQMAVPHELDALDRALAAWLAGLGEATCPWPVWQDAVSELRPQLVSVTRDAEGLIEAIPDEWLSPARKRFAALVLGRRVTLLG